MEQETKTDVAEYHEGDILRLEDICLIGTDRMAVADHANGIMIFNLQSGKLERHLNCDKDTLAFSVKYNAFHHQLEALVLDVPGWMLNIYELVDGNWTLTRQVPTPQQPFVDRMKLRWLSVTSGGDTLLLASGHVWTLVRQEGEWSWRLLGQNGVTGVNNNNNNNNNNNVWYSHLTPYAEEKDRFVVCWRGDSLRRARVTDDRKEFVVEKGHLSTPAEIEELGAFTIDPKGNMLISDWKTGKVVVSEKSGQKRTLGSVGEAEAYVMVADGQKVYVGCKSSLQVRAFTY